jgi:hypothetical protein
MTKPKPIDEPWFAAEVLAYVVAIIAAIWFVSGGGLYLLDKVVMSL